MNLKKTVTENLGVKLIALVVAVFIWFNASGQQEVARIRTIPIVIENVADSVTVTSPVPPEVEISVQGTKRQLLTMGFKRVHLAVDMSGVEPGRQRLALTANQIRLPGGINRRQVSVISPGFIDLDVESIVSREVRVSLETRGSVPGNVVLMDGAMAVDPPTVTIRGAASRVEAVTSVSTEAFDLSRVKGPIDRELAVVYDPRRFSCVPDRVRVRADVKERGQRVLANVPPTLLVDSDDYTARVIPTTVSLTLEGAVSVLDTLSSGDVSVLLNLSGRAPARYRLAPEVILPDGVELAGISVDSLTVVITRADRLMER